MAIKAIEILIKAKDQASGVFDSLKGKAAAVATAIAGYFGISAFVGAVKGAADLEAMLSEVGAVSNATAQEMVELRQAAADAGATTKFTATEAAAALAELARTGLSAKDSIATLPPVLQLAQAGKVGLAQSAEIVTGILAGFVLKADQAGRVADVLAKGADSSKTSVLGLAQALSYAAPVAKGLGLSVEFTVALIGKFADANIDASRAGTALNAILSQFSDPASKFREELRNAGITTSNFETALRQLAKAGPAGKQAILAVGTEAGPALQALLNLGIGALDDLQGKLKDASGAAAETAAKIQNNLNGSLSNLSSAWDAVKIALGTPVLPVVRDAVDQLSKALTAAVSDGTIKRFGEAITAAFQSGLDWARQFLAQVDFTDLTQRMQAFTAEMGATFRQIGESARSAGDIVQTAYGVMAAGANAVLAAIYGVGGAFARMAEGVFKGIALLRDGFSSITFGGFSKAIKEAADEAREEAAAFGAVAKAMEEKAGASFEAMADGAQIARKGWSGLTASMQAGESQSSASSRAIATVTQNLQAMGSAATAAGAQAQAAAAQQQKASDDARAAIAKLREEYSKAIATNNLQLATEKHRELTKAINDSAAAAQTNTRAQQEAADAIKAAFLSVGISTKADLEKVAADALRHFELIKSSGLATTDGLKTAWQKYAEAAIAANGGVATGTLKAQASMQGLEITADSTGKSIVRALASGTAAAGTLTEAVQLTTEQLRAQEDALDRVAMKYKLTADYTERQIALLERENELMERRDALERKRLNIDKNGFALDKAGNTVNAGGDLTTLTGIANFLKSAGLDDAAARSLAREFSDSKGNIPYTNNPGQMKYGGLGSTMSQALMKAVEQRTFGTGSGGGAPLRVSETPASGQASKTVNLRINGGASHAMPESSAQGLIKDLQQAKIASVG